MAVETWETITVGAVSGSFGSNLIRKELTGTIGPEWLGPFRQKPVAGSLGAGALFLALAAIGSRGRGPLGASEAAQNLVAAAGGASLGSGTLMAMYVAQGGTLSPSGGVLIVSGSHPNLNPGTNPGTGTPPSPRTGPSRPTKPKIG